MPRSHPTVSARTARRRESQAQPKSEPSTHISPQPSGRDGARGAPAARGSGHGGPWRDPLRRPSPSPPRRSLETAAPCHGHGLVRPARRGRRHGRQDPRAQRVSGIRWPAGRGRRPSPCPTPPTHPPMPRVPMREAHPLLPLFIAQLLHLGVHAAQLGRVVVPGTASRPAFRVCPAAAHPMDPRVSSSLGGQPYARRAETDRPGLMTKTLADLRTVSNSTSNPRESCCTWHTNRYLGPAAQCAATT